MEGGLIRDLAESVGSGHEHLSGFGRYPLISPLVQLERTTIEMQELSILGMGVGMVSIAVSLDPVYVSMTHECTNPILAH